MLPLTRSRNRARFFGIPFSPSTLFQGGTVAGAWYDPSDLSTMFDTSAGTTPVAMPGLGAAVPVGLMLDKSQGLVLGSELVTNGDFSSGTTGWSALNAATLTAPASALVVANSGTNFGGADQAISTVIGTTYRVTCTFVRGTSSAVYLQAGTTSGGAQNGFATSTTSSGSLQVIFRATATTTYISLFNGESTAGLFNTFDSVSLRTLAGNHAISFNNTTARPELRARVNLLTYSEEFDNGAWGKVGGIVPLVTVTANTTSAPNGTTTADTLSETVDNAYHSTYSTNTVTAGLTVVGSVCIKKSSVRYAQINYGGSVAGRWVQCVIDLDTGLITQSSAGAGGTLVSALSTPLGDNWYRVTLTGSVVTDTTTYFYIGTVTSAAPSLNTFGLEVRAGNVSNSVFIWGADLRPANIGANVPAYQRIADANTYDTSGFPLYLRFDGIDDSMYTPANLNLSGTDKVAVFAGVRKLSDAAGGVVSELSNTSGAPVGWFGLYAPSSAASNYTVRVTGTAENIRNYTTYVAPITNVVSINIKTTATDSADAISFRADGAVNAGTSATSSASTGNFGTYPLFIGARNNASLWFNGHLHSLIIAGSAVSAGNISATEQWVAGKTGISIFDAGPSLGLDFTAQLYQVWEF